MDKTIILFDGVCNLCTGAVRFIIPRDPLARFRFASLQSSHAQALLRERGIDPRGIDSIIVINNSQWFARSDAALEIARHLSGGWWLIYAFKIVPRPVRDAVYGWIARNRYQWFGRRDVCMVATPELEARFLN